MFWEKTSYEMETYDLNVAFCIKNFKEHEFNEKGNKDKMIQLQNEIKREMPESRKLRAETMLSPQ